MTLWRRVFIVNDCFWGLWLMALVGVWLGIVFVWGVGLCLGQRVDRLRRVSGPVLRGSAGSEIPTLSQAKAETNPNSNPQTKTKTNTLPKVMSELHDRAPRHSAAYSAAAVRAAFGQDATALFESFEAEAVASGSIAQVGAGRGGRAAYTQASGRQGRPERRELAESDRDT